MVTRSPDGSLQSTTTLMRFLPVIAAFVGLGCSGGESKSESGGDSTGTGARAATAPAAWYARERTLDLTGDGKAAIARLEARGDRPDSLGIALALLVAGEEKHREVWGSSYELALLDSATRRSPELERILRARLDSVLASVVVQRLGDPGIRLMPGDSAVLAAIVPRPTQRISFSYGYESTTRLVWDMSGERFVRLWSCC